MAPKKKKSRPSERITQSDIKLLVSKHKELPLLPVRDVVSFPSVMLSLSIAQAANQKAIFDAEKTGGLLLVVAQANLISDEPTIEDLYHFGTIGKIARILQLNDGRLKVLVQGLARAQIEAVNDTGGTFRARIKPIIPSDKQSDKIDSSVLKQIREQLDILVRHEHLPEELLLLTEELDNPGELADIIAAHYRLEIPKAQALLEESNPSSRLKIVAKLIDDDLQQFFISEQVRDQAQNEMAKGQRDYYLREQIKVLHRELGDHESASDEITQLKKAILEAKLPPHARQEADRQLIRLERMSAEASEYALLRTYLDWLSELPWSVVTADTIDLKVAKRILDSDHFGLAKAKDRILEYLSVRKLNPGTHGPILCFCGPPGVGKTSLGRSIAKSLGRKFYRLSLGGVRDEAEIRGHRRTYVGALPGRVIQGLKQAGSKNPVMVLDELDKVGNDFRGDPASALLEVLDPQQNKEFSDHYLGIPFDLSEVLFITTANTTDTIPDALLDRLEVIYISGYTTFEKVQISKRFLIPRQSKENGLKGKKLSWKDAAIEFVVERYTAEAGVRGLEREFASIFRKLARQSAEKKTFPKEVTKQLVQKLLGPTKYDPEQNERRALIGHVRGLAWTIAGGEMMPVEASLAVGKGNLSLTGQLGDVMQESAQAALFYARAHTEELGLDPQFHDKHDIHIHVPNGATPKDGPSAGITIATALVSALSRRPVASDLAMTGEITLGGTVLQIGGLKEKALAALRYGIKKIIIPYDNIKDLEDIPKEQRAKMKFYPVRHISEVLRLALLKPVKSTEAKVLQVGSKKPVKSGTRSLVR